MPDLNIIARAISLLEQGGIIAYPTEGVYGLGCCPFNQLARQRLTKIKQRPADKAFVLVASEFQQIADLINTKNVPGLDALLATWPGPITWVFPLSPHGEVKLNQTGTLAVRISAHPVVHTLCQAFGKPLISSSANVFNQKPLCHTTEVEEQFSDKVDFIVPGKVGTHIGPTPIFDALSKKALRKRN